MVAARAAPRPRAVAVALTIVLMLPAVALLVPTAEATHTTSTATLTAAKKNYIKGETIQFTVTVTKVDCTGTLASSITGVKLHESPAKRIGGTNLDFVQETGTNTWRLSMPIGAPLAGQAGLNNEPLAFGATVTFAACTTELGASNTVEATPDTLTIDNVGPAGPVRFGVQPSGQYAITIDSASIADVAGAHANLAAIGGSTAQNLSVSSSPQSYPVAATTTPGSVVVSLNDPRGIAADFTSPPRLPDNLQVFPIAGGKVHVRFTTLLPTPTATYGFAVKPPSASTWTLIDSSMTNFVEKLHADTDATHDYVLSAGLFDLNQANLVRVYEKVGGNDGVPSNAFSVTPANSPNAVTVTSPPSGSVRDLGVLSGTYSVASGATASLRLSLTTPTNPTQYWQNTTTTPFSTTVHHEALVAANGAWSTDILSLLGENAAAVDAIPDSAYNLTVELLANGVPAVNATFPFLLDTTSPVAGASADMKVTGAYPDGVQQGTPIQVQLRFTDALSPIKNVSFQLRQKDGGNPRIVGANDQFVSLECAKPACLVTGDYNQHADFWGNASVVLPFAPVGNYSLQAFAYDAAGNEAASTLTQLFTPGPANPAAVRITPAVQLKNPVLRGDSLFLDVLATARGKTSISPPEDCAAYGIGGYNCKVSQVRIEGRNTGGTGTPTAQVLATLVAPHGQMTTEGGRSWWNYTLDSGVGLGTLNRAQPIQVRAVARVDGTVNEGFTAWTPVQTPTNPGGIQFRTPSADWKINSTDKVSFLLNLTVLSPSSQPYIKGVVKRLDAPAPDVAVGALQPYKHTSTHVPNFIYNYSYNATPLANGQYALVVNAYTAETEPSGVPLATATRYFAVQKEPPVVAIANVTQTQVHPRTDNWVGRNFVLNAYVDPGQANLSSSSFDFKLQRNVRGTGKTILSNNEEGFVVQVLNPAELNPVDKDAVVKLNVTLPGSALDGDTFILSMAAKTDADPLPPGVAWRNTTNVTYGFRLDAADPTAGVDYAETNVTAITANGELRIIGFARDTGVGVEEVRVRLVNLTSNSTFSWASGAFVDGTELGFWATSKPVKMRDGGYVRDVGIFQNFTTSPVHSLLWSVNETNRPKLDALGADTGDDYPRVPLDRASRYRVDVQVVDRLGRASSYSSEVGLDPEGPRLLSPLMADPGPYAWHGWANFSVQVSDNYCVARLSIVGRTDTGKDVGPVDFPRPAGAACGTPTADDPHVWRLDARHFPALTDEVANVTYWVRATDPSGNVTETPLASRTLVRAVEDRQKALVPFLRLEPPLVGPGTRSRVVAEVFENHAIDRVRVFFHRVNPDRSYTLLAEGLARPLTTAGNGTGEWVAETDTDLQLTNLTLGDYLWEVRPMDRHWETTCATPAGTFECAQQGILLRVVNDAGVQIVQESPARNATFVNATPVFRFQVFDRNVTAGGITLRAGNATANMTTVTPTSVTDLPLVAGQRTGVAVEYRPNLANQTRIALQLTAASEGGMSNSTSVLQYEVDAVPPTVTHNVTGLQDHGNRSYAVAATRVTLNATDAHGATLTYRVGGTGDFLPYPAAGITPTGADGEWRLEYRATDAAGNVERGNLTLTLDKTGPVIVVSKHGDDLLVSVTDAGAGVNASTVKVFYAYGNATTFTPATMERTTGNSYRVQLTGNANVTGLRYYFEATDNLGTVGRLHSAASPYAIQPDSLPQNLPPTLQITSPPANQQARDKVELRWLASDPEQANVTITIALRSPTGQGRILQTAGPNNGTWVVDVAGAPAGTHTLVVTASDGEKTTQESVNFFVERGQLIEVITPPPVEVEESRLVDFALRVNPGAKQVQGVTYTLMRGNDTVSTGGMKLTGTTYAASIITEDPGEYKVLVTVAYADGTSEPQAQVASFTVKAAESGAPPAAFPASLVTLVVLALATIALAAYAAFVRWPR